MSSYVLSCCSTVDLSAEHLKRRNIKYACFHFSLDGKEYIDDLGKSISYKDFYKAMLDGAETKTSQINVDGYMEYFEPFLQQGKDILHVCLSSGISGSYNSAKIAKETLAEKYPERKIRVVDSLGASSGSGLLMNKLADLRDQGMELDELADWAEQHKLEIHHWFFSADLTFYVKGGRITKAAGWFGTVLKICPVLNVDNTGHLIPRKKIRGKKKAIEEIVNQMEAHAQNGLKYADTCYICHSDCPEDAQAVAELVEKRFRHLPEKVLINNIGTTIGSHSGPGTVAVFFWGDQRAD